MTLQDAVSQTLAKLRRAGIPDARLDAEYLVAEAAGIPRLRLALRAKSRLSSEATRKLTHWTSERLERRPLAYVLGEQPFLDLSMRVNPSVLVPRPETELLVEEAFRVLDARKGAVVADVGTGSGNIALALARHPNVSEVHAIDISNAALAVAQQNALHNGSPHPVHWHLGDLLSPLLDAGIKADVIAANLPYIRTDVMPDLSPEVRWEPALALDGGEDGLSYIYQVIEQAEQVLNPGGSLFLEIGWDQGDAVQNKLQSRAGWTRIQLRRDLAGHPRIVSAQRG